ncbi:hypothetical protein Aduo_006000 [Ancylostoma duodenale]
MRFLHFLLLLVAVVLATSLATPDEYPLSRTKRQWGWGGPWGYRRRWGYGGWGGPGWGGGWGGGFYPGMGMGGWGGGFYPGMFGK